MPMSHPLHLASWELTVSYAVYHRAGCRQRHNSEFEFVSVFVQYWWTWRRDDQWVDGYTCTVAPEATYVPGLK